MEVGGEVVAVHHVNAPELVVELEHLEDDGDDPRVGGKGIAIKGEGWRHFCS